MVFSFHSEMQFYQSTLPHGLPIFQYEFCEWNSFYNKMVFLTILRCWGQNSSLLLILLTAVFFKKRHLVFPIALSFLKTHLDNHHSLPTQKISCPTKLLFMEGHLRQVRYLFLSILPVKRYFWNFLAVNSTIWPMLLKYGLLYQKAAISPL